MNAAADAIHWLLHDSGETADYFVGEGLGAMVAAVGSQPWMAHALFRLLLCCISYWCAADVASMHWQV